MSTGLPSRLRAGLHIDRRIAGLAPVAALVIGGLGVAANVASSDGDIRDGLFPWTMAISVVCLAVCCLGVLAVHRSAPGWWTTTGAWWTATAFAGIAGAFVTIGIGALLGIEEDDAGILALLPLVAMAFGLLSMAPATAVLGIGVTRSHVLPWWGITAVWVAAPVLPLLLIAGGLAEGTAETMSMVTLMGTFVVAWIVIGASVARTPDRAAVSS